MNAFDRLKERVAQLEMLVVSLEKRFERHNDCTDVHMDAGKAAVTEKRLTVLEVLARLN